MLDVSPSRDQLYGRQWRKARRAYITQHPLCIMCQRQGKLTAATVVDHEETGKAHEEMKDARFDPAKNSAGCHEDAIKALRQEHVKAKAKDKSQDGKAAEATP